MSAAYLIAQLKVTNSENYKEYIEKVPEIIKKYGGEYLARGGEYTVVEGEDNYPRIILIKFPSYEKALRMVSFRRLQTYKRHTFAKL